MADIIFPVGVDYVSMEIGLDFSDNVTQSALSGESGTLTRSPGLWRGSFLLGQVDIADNARLIETWVFEMQSRINSSLIPLQGSSTYELAAISIDSVASLVGGRLQYQLSGAYSRLKQGHWIRIGRRRFVVATISGANAVFLPELPDLSVGTSIFPATDINVIMDPQASFSPVVRTADQWGPWAFSFREFIEA